MPIQEPVTCAVLFAFQFRHYFIFIYWQYVLIFYITLVNQAIELLTLNKFRDKPSLLVELRWPNPNNKKTISPTRMYPLLSFKVIIFFRFAIIQLPSDTDVTEGIISSLSTTWWNLRRLRCLLKRTNWSFWKFWDVSNFTYLQKWVHYLLLHLCITRQLCVAIWMPEIANHKIPLLLPPTFLGYVKKG